jgi:GNAT superfamily N-acetyltransferase
MTVAAKTLSEPALFTLPGLRAQRLGAADVPALQHFFEANPDYFLSTGGEPPRPDEAQQELDDDPPAGMTYRERGLLGIVDDAGQLRAMASLLSDFLAPGVWHLSLYWLADALHGRGAAGATLAALQRWAAAQGAQWLRLGVVRGNMRAERFWERQGFVQTRERGPVAIGRRQPMLRVMVKPLAGGTPAQYLTLVARDRPGAP